MRLNELGKVLNHFNHLNISIYLYNILSAEITHLFHVNPNVHLFFYTRQVSDADGYLERTFMSLASVTAGNVIRGWMEDAGLRTLVF